eukprot:TRINITY_DN684_c0_g1_i1.p1 TRINITY_DN684_c0_g1~~TRINITY_DN684_c0_g1_i1.p1  ORF type:complete len:365 (+),score=93.62 TRINITY_DN684_c0_g1_i1:323-1417(+)
MVSVKKLYTIFVGVPGIFLTALGVMYAFYRALDSFLELLPFFVAKGWLLGIVTVFGFIIFGSIAIQWAKVILVKWFLPTVNVAKRYSARWALVTGATYGIGREIALELASQGLSLILVDLKSRDFVQLVAHLQHLHKENKTQQFVRVITDLSCKPEEYMDAIKAKVSEVGLPNVVFINAGYIVLGGFARSNIEENVRNIECNVMSGVRLAHFFMDAMIEKQTRGLIAFTASSASMLPSPVNATYSAGKSFISSFADSLALEGSKYGIDVLSINPGPVKSHFLDKNVAGTVPKLHAFDTIYKMASTPNAIVSTTFRAIGRITVLDADIFTLLLRTVRRFIEPDMWITVMKIVEKILGDENDKKHY